MSSHLEHIADQILRLTYEEMLELAEIVGSAAKYCFDRNDDTTADAWAKVLVGAANTIHNRKESE